MACYGINQHIERRFEQCGSRHEWIATKQGFTGAVPHSSHDFMIQIHPNLSWIVLPFQTCITWNTTISLSTLWCNSLLPSIFSWFCFVSFSFFGAHVTHNFGYVCFVRISTLIASRVQNCCLFGFPIGSESTHPVLLLLWCNNWVEQTSDILPKSCFSVTSDHRVYFTLVCVQDKKIPNKTSQNTFSKESQSQ